MDQTLTIKEAAEYLNFSYHTVFHYRHKWGFFRMNGVRGWRIHKKDLDQHKKRSNNDPQVNSVGRYQKDKLCRSSNEMTTGGLILLHQVEKELDGLLKQPSKRKP